MCHLPVRKAFPRCHFTENARKLQPNCQSRHLDLDGLLKGLALLLLASVGLGTHDSTTPVALGLLGLLKVTLLDGGDELGELRVVLGADLGDGEDGSGLSDEGQHTNI